MTTAIGRKIVLNIINGQDCTRCPLYHLLRFCPASRSVSSAFAESATPDLLLMHVIQSHRISTISVAMVTSEEDLYRIRYSLSIHACHGEISGRSLIITSPRVPLLVVCKHPRWSLLWGSHWGRQCDPEPQVQDNRPFYLQLTFMSACPSCILIVATGQLVQRLEHL